MSTHNELERDIPEVILKKVLFDKNELATEKIVKIWENLTENNLSKSSDLKKFGLILKYKKYKNSLKRVLKELFFKKLISKNKNLNFSNLNKKDIDKKIKKLKSILGINHNIECKLISDKTLLIKKS